LLTPALDAQAVVGSLLAFRAIYYLAPLVLASLALGVHELGIRPTVTRRIAHLFEDWGSAVVPQVLALGVFLSGTLLLFSNATPDTPVRLARLAQVLPLPVLEASHFLASLAGLGLVLVAYDVQRRVDAAYVTSAVLLAAGIVLSLLKGLTVENAVALAIMLAALLPCRP